VNAKSRKLVRDTIAAQMALLALQAANGIDVFKGAEKLARKYQEVR